MLNCAHLSTFVNIKDDEKKYSSEYDPSFVDADSCSLEYFHDHNRQRRKYSSEHEP